MLGKVKMKQPLVAVCVPTYEKVGYFKRLYESVEKQTYVNWILIVTDDSRTDEIERYVDSKKNQDIYYFHNDVQLGAVNNTNSGIKKAIELGAEYIKPLFHDDWFATEDALEKMVEIAVINDPGMVICGNVEEYPDRKFVRICSNKDICLLRKKLSYIFDNNCFGAPSNVLFRAEEYFFDSNFEWLLDVDFYCNILSKTNFEYIYMPYISIGHDGAQLTDYYNQHPIKKYQELKKLYQKYNWMRTSRNLGILVRKYIWAHGMNVFTLFKRRFMNEHISKNID